MTLIYAIVVALMTSLHPKYSYQTTLC